MKEIIDNSKNDKVKNCAALLSNNIEQVMNEMCITQGMTSLGRSGNMILYMILPRYHHNEKVTSQPVVTASALDKICLLKIMAEQSNFIIENIRERDHRFADWVEGAIFSFLRRLANEWLINNNAKQISI